MKSNERASTCSSFHQKGQSRCRSISSHPFRDGTFLHIGEHRRLALTVNCSAHFGSNQVKVGALEEAPTLGTYLPRYAMYLPAQLPACNQHLHSVRVNIPSSQLGSNLQQNRRLDPLFSASTSMMPVKLPISEQNSSRR